MHHKIDVTGNVYEVGNIVMNKFKTRAGSVSLNVFKLTSDQIVHRDHVMSISHKAINQMRTDETCAARY